jgi:hypothetical protein
MGLIPIITLSLISRRTEEKSDIKEVIMKNIINANTMLI